MSDNKKTIAIQGDHGSFHEIATRNYFKNEEVTIFPCDTFADLVDSIEDGQADYGLMAIENTVSGSLIFNYTLLRESSLKIIGETSLRIKQNLVALPGQTINDLGEIHSHYMALNQCRIFLKKIPNIKLIESIDTALSAKEISENNIKGRGAIASSLAAKMYNLEILGHSIETNKKNFTRFLVITKNDNNDIKPKDLNKTSLWFSLQHSKGSLSQVLSVITFYDINLTKIQSLPIIGHDFEYLFYIDLVYDDYERYKQCLEAIKPLIRNLNILGEYQIGEKFYED